MPKLNNYHPLFSIFLLTQLNILYKLNNMGILYILGTPIGNLKDITLRALETLKTVDFIACEDTRHSRKLLTKYEIKKPLISCRAHNEVKAAEKIDVLLSEGNNIAYISDAGTPGISDPGYRLVQIVRKSGNKIIPIPGVSAVTMITSIGGYHGKTFVFDGFLSTKQGKRRKRLEELLQREENFVLYESPYRIVKLLHDIADIEPERRLIVGREMTKRYEEYIEGKSEEIYADFSARNKIYGEFSILVSGNKKS